jgi:hypothetical protein
MRWMAEKPTKSGWYWWREHRKTDPFILRIFPTGRICECGSTNDCQYLLGEWQGPIPEPKEGEHESM